MVMCLCVSRARPLTKTVELIIASLDRAVSSALGTPVSLPDMYITSPLCEAIPEAESPVPWLHDCHSTSSSGEPDLRTFAHICKIRSLQSLFMHIVEKDDLDGTLPLELEMHMLTCLREWEDSEVIAKHRYVTRSY